MPINILEWVTCPYCGVNFQVSVTSGAKRIVAAKAMTSWQREYFRSTCPKCEEDNVINLA